MSGKRADRMRRILQLLHEHSSRSLAELAEDLGVSAATLRRDLADLDEQGELVRTHGGARERGSRSEIPVRLRDSRFRHEKQVIARRAVDLIPAGPYALALSGGTTTAEVARALRHRSGLTVITNSLAIAMECVAWPRLQVLITGGVIRPSSLEAVGSLAEASFRAINVGTAILGTDGISAAGGVTTHDETEARTNHAMVAKAQRVIVVADGSKIGQATLAKMADLGEVDDLVTDSSADPAALREISDAGVTVHVVDASPRSPASGHDR
ncbi:alkaline phosphatase [Rathayibacter caricis DSM 15933]|uniref:Alkaline phosphatase n=2 Tax=Rathayibacter caricis TaxID=110936 RepID=A0A2T4UYF5_9MICO|nr:alkaline phosphatase [Rathayibacter caricis DSM 15933]